MCHKDRRACADRGGQNGHVLRVGKLGGPFAVARGRPVDLDWNRTEELLEEWRGFRQLGGQISPNLGHGGLGQHQAEEAKFAEHQDRVTGAGAAEKSGDQDVSVDANE
jgi:hypothetical protein